MRDFHHDDKDALVDDDDTVPTGLTVMIVSKNTSDTGNLGETRGDDDDDDVLTHEIANCFLALLADVNN